MQYLNKIYKFNWAGRSAWMIHLLMSVRIMSSKELRLRPPTFLGIT